MNLNYAKGNLFSSDDDVSLVHCVSKDMKMGMGIAAQFKNIFGNIDELKNQNKKIGEVAHLQCSDRYVFYLVTKNRYSDKPTYYDVRTSLTNLRLLCDDLNITKLAMPKIACGLGKLSWPIVENIIKSIFSNSEITISIYYL